MLIKIKNKFNTLHSLYSCCLSLILCTLRRFVQARSRCFSGNQKFFSQSWRRATFLSPFSLSSLGYKKLAETLPLLAQIYSVSKLSPWWSHSSVFMVMIVKGKKWWRLITVLNGNYHGHKKYTPSDFLTINFLLKSERERLLRCGWLYALDIW